jgi:hypothetical protein
MRHDHDGYQQQDDGTPAEVALSRIDVPFLELTWFFIKASLAMALAFSVTSWLWVLIGTAIVSLSAGLLFVLGIPRLLLAPQVAPAELSPVEVHAPADLSGAPGQPGLPEPAIAPEAVAPTEPPGDIAPVEPPPAPRDPNREATEAAQRAELERLRKERGQR